ncbi:Rieske (2Fe-2S) protein [uncultured Micrococcus sp.]|uniref:Rieske (2Fe-2S) protein n=1 Tax=uncultured Micrococcus sp. TaxID=114051 RepID=UPI002591E18B|nr:Rieske (2Fe-2S) protein [uncultured Micrococcus sp.]
MTSDSRSEKVPAASPESVAEAHACAQDCSPRRSVLRGSAAVAAAGAGTLALSGCTQQLKDDASAAHHYDGADPTPVLKAAELPVGESTSVEVDGRTLLMHRVSEGEVVAFSNSCTHQGCAVAVGEREGQTTFACPCHGSHFDVETGKPYGGPARKPLMDFEASVDGEDIVVKL